MEDDYHIDPEKFSLKKFQGILQSRELIPSRASLKNDLEERLQMLRNHDISTLKDLLDVLKTKPKLERFAKESRLSIEYLTLLNREAKSYLPNPIRLDKFSGVDQSDVEKLKAMGIKNTRHLFNTASHKNDRERLAATTEIPIHRLDELVGLSDLSRAYGVGPVFARMLFDVGIKSIKDLIGYSSEEIIRIYEISTEKKADFGVAEIQFTLDLAKELNRQDD